MPSATYFSPEEEEEEEIDIMNHSDEEPLPDFPLCDTLPLPDIPATPPSNMTFTPESPSHSTKARNRSKSKIRESTSSSYSESSDDSGDDTRVFMKDIKARDYWERFERRMYQQQQEKRNQVIAQKWLAGNRRAPEQIQKEKEVEKLVCMDVFAPVPKEIVNELEVCPLTMSSDILREELKTPSYREVQGYDIHDGYEDEATFQFLRGYNNGRLSSDWHEPELAILSPKKMFTSYTRSFSGECNLSQNIKKKKKQRHMPPRHKNTSLPSNLDDSPRADPPPKRRALSDMRTARSKARRDLASSRFVCEKIEDIPSVPEFGLDFEIFGEPLTPPMSPSMFFNLSPCGSPVPTLTSSDASCSPLSESAFDISIKEEPMEEDFLAAAEKIDDPCLILDIEPVVVKKEKMKSSKKSKSKSKEKHDPERKVVKREPVDSSANCKAKKKSKEKKEEDEEPNAKRAKRFCMSPQVQKHFQLTLWYEEEKVLFKELFCAFGRDWAHISTLMNGTKSPTQIKNFYYDVRRSLLASLFGLAPEDLPKEYTPPLIKAEETILDESGSGLQDVTVNEETSRDEVNSRKRPLNDEKDKGKKPKDKSASSNNDRDKAGPPKKKSKSGNMVFKPLYTVPSTSLPSTIPPLVPQVGASVFCQYRHAPGWVEASVLSLKGNGDEMKVKLLVKGLPHYRAFWATLPQVFYSLEEGEEVFEYSVEDSEIEKNNTPPNNTYTPPMPLPPTASSVPQPPPVIDPSEQKIVPMVDSVQPLVDSLVPVDRNKLHQWLENKLESMNSSSGIGGASASGLISKNGGSKDKSTASSLSSSSSSVPASANLSPLGPEVPNPPSPDSPTAISLPQSQPSLLSSSMPLPTKLSDSTGASSNSLSQLSSMNARYKCYLECTNALFEEKDLVSINFTSVFMTTTGLGEYESSQWRRRNFDTLLASVDQGVSLIMSRSSSRKCPLVQSPPPVPKKQPQPVSKAISAPPATMAVTVQPPKNVATVVITTDNIAPAAPCLVNTPPHAVQPSGAQQALAPTVSVQQPLEATLSHQQQDVNCLSPQKPAVVQLKLQGSSDTISVLQTHAQTAVPVSLVHPQKSAVSTVNVQSGPAVQKTVQIQPQLILPKTQAQAQPAQQQSTPLSLQQKLLQQQVLLQQQLAQLPQGQQQVATTSSPTKVGGPKVLVPPAQRATPNLQAAAQSVTVVPKPNVAYPCNIKGGVCVNACVPTNKIASSKIAFASEASLVTSAATTSPVSLKHPAPVVSKPVALPVKGAALMVQAQTQQPKMIIPCVTSVPHKPVNTDNSNNSISISSVIAPTTSPSLKITVATTDLATTNVIPVISTTTNSTINTKTPATNINHIGNTSTPTSAPSPPPCMPMDPSNTNGCKSTNLNKNIINNSKSIAACNISGNASLNTSTTTITTATAPSSPLSSVPPANTPSESSQSLYLTLDKSPVPYKLFIAKRELLLESRRLLRAMCERISLENKKNIETGATTEGIRQRMEELTRELEMFKHELLAIASERYTVFKESLQTPDTIHNVIS